MKEVKNHIFSLHSFMQTADADWMWLKDIEEQYSLNDINYFNDRSFMLLHHIQTEAEKIIETIL